MHMVVFRETIQEWLPCCEIVSTAVRGATVTPRSAAAHEVVTGCGRMEVIEVSGYKKTHSCGDIRKKVFATRIAIRKRLALEMYYEKPIFWQHILV